MLQNKNIILVLQEFYSSIQQLSAEDYNTVKDGLELWQTNSSNDIITIYDKDSLRKIAFLQSTLLPGIRIEPQSPTAGRSTESPSTLKASGSQFKLISGGFISTQQMLNRVLYILSVYFSQE